MINLKTLLYIVVRNITQRAEYLQRIGDNFNKVQVRVFKQIALF